MEQATAIHDRLIGQILVLGSDRQRIAYLSTLQGSLYAFLSLVLQHFGDSPNAIRAAFELVLRRKAIAAEAVATQRDALLGGKYPALEPRLRDLAALRMQMAARRSRVLDLEVSTLTCKDSLSGRPRKRGWRRSWPDRSPR